VVALTDASANVARTYAYDAWGRGQSAGEGGPANPFSFTGREYDAETGLYYLRARYYDPAVGRFISPDPLDLPGLLLAGQSPRHEQVLLPQAAVWALRAEITGLISGLREAAQHAPERLNRYAYAVNNPLLVKDPSGLHICGMVLEMTPEGLVWAPTFYESVAELDAAIEAAILVAYPDYGDFDANGEKTKQYYREQWLKGWRPPGPADFSMYPRSPSESGRAIIGGRIR
jgi:RHS repeat-associated protein